VILQIVIRHETLVALIAAETKVALVHASIVSPQRKLVHRDETARVAGIRNAAVQLHVARHCRRAFERLLTNRAFVRTHIAVLHHVSSQIPSTSEKLLARGTLVPRALFPRLGFSSLLRVGRSSPSAQFATSSRYPTSLHVFRRL